MLGYTTVRSCGLIGRCFTSARVVSINRITAARLSSAISSKKEEPQYDIKNVVVIGGGLMGSGIAQVAAQNNFNVTIVDSEDEYLQKCMVMIMKSLGRITKKKFPGEPKGATKFIDDTLSKIKTSRNIGMSVVDADLVIESVTENLALKHSVLREADVAAPQKTLFASNTSSMSITEIALATKRPDRFGGLHFFHPVPLMQLIEVIRAEGTSDAAFKALYNFAKDMGKSPVICKDTPGFIVNRLLIPYMFEAVRFMERGLASAADIDTAMKLGAGYPMGPFELLDYVGLDTQKFIIDNWHKLEPSNPLFEPSPTVDRLVTEGKLGQKTGEGFYKYGNGK